MEQRDPTVLRIPEVCRWNRCSRPARPPPTWDADAAYLIAFHEDVIRCRGALPVR